MADNTVANFNFMFTSNADALTRQWDDLIKKAGDIDKAFKNANKVLEERIKLENKEIEVTHKKRTERPQAVEHETRMNRLRREGNSHIDTRIKKLGALAVAAISANKVMGGISSAFSGGVDVAMQAKLLGEDPAELENYARVTERFEGDKKTLYSNLQNIGTQLGDVKLKGDSPILRLSQALGIKLRDGDNSDRSVIDIHRSMMDVISRGKEEDRNVILSLMKEMGMDRSGALMAGAGKDRMNQEMQDVQKLHQRSEKETQALLELSRSLTEMSQSIQSLVDKLISWMAPELTTGANVISDLLQGDTSGIKSKAGSAAKGVESYFMRNYMQPGGDQIYPIKNYIENIGNSISDALKEQIEYYKNNQDFRNTSINNTSHNMGGMVNNFTVGSNDEAASLIKSVYIVDNTMMS